MKAIIQYFKAINKSCENLESRYELRGFITEADIKRAFNFSPSTISFITFLFTRFSEWQYYYVDNSGNKYPYKFNAPTDKQKELTKCFIKIEDESPQIVK